MRASSYAKYYSEGRDAFYANLRPSACPYVPGSPAEEAWSSGWLYAHDSRAQPEDYEAERYPR
jgi:hypothetical protein